MRAKAAQIASSILRFAYEPNGSADFAIPVVGLKVGEKRIFTGELTTSTDVDIFIIKSVPVNGVITVDVDARTLSPASALDSYVRLFSSSGTLLTVNDDFGGTADSFLNSPSSLPAGDYYVGISGFQNQNYNVISGSGTSAATTTGPYKVTISLS